VIDGRLHRGTGAAGEIGFIATAPDDAINSKDSRDPIAQAVVQQVARDFARALAPAVLVLDPTAVVIGGGVARAGAVLLDAISDQLRLLTLNHPKLELSALAEDAVVTGAMRMALDEVWQRKLPVQP
jgi:predicted NBD/HSP70 family sugar kinase